MIVHAFFKYDALFIERVLLLLCLCARLERQAGLQTVHLGVQGSRVLFRLALRRFSVVNLPVKRLQLLSELVAACFQLGFPVLLPSGVVIRELRSFLRFVKAVNRAVKIPVPGQRLPTVAVRE